MNLSPLSRTAAIGVAVLGLATLSSTAEATFIATLQEIGPDAVLTGSGSINTTGLAFERSTSPTNGLLPSTVIISIGAPSGPLSDVYTGPISGPTNFGPGLGQISTSGSGDEVLLELATLEIDVPLGYVSGDPLSDTMTFANTT